MASPSRFLCPIFAISIGLLLATADMAAADPTLVAEFHFEDAQGQADPQGWRELQKYQDEEAYFHVEDFSGQGHIVTALAGQRSMWCGLALEDPRACGWGFAPGYGSHWRQNLSSAAFTVQGDVTLSFLMSVSVEPGYDYVFIQYEDAAGLWQELDNYSCGTPYNCGPPNRSYTIPAADHDGMIRFRFHLASDGAGDAETFPIGFNDPYGLLVDDLTVSDATGVISSQDFETEDPGAQVTLDGDWFAEPNGDAYHGGVLVSGLEVLQESPTYDATPVWAFFNGSTRDYACAGHPEQLIVDVTESFIRSPRIDITKDLLGRAIGGEPDSLVVEFDVYRDISPVYSRKFYNWAVATYSADCLEPLHSRGANGSGIQKDWYRHSIRFVPEAGTQYIVVELGVSSLPFLPVECRSHSPLFDNVTVSRIGGFVSGVDDQPRRAPRSALHIAPNPFNPGTTIRFEAPPGSRQVRLRIYGADGRLVTTLVDGQMMAGPQSVPWDGKDRNGRDVASGVYLCELVVDEVRESRKMILIE